MRALLAAVGTRGDVQPALALALELRKLGHAVRLCISPNFVDWAKSLGLEAVPMGVEMRMPAQRSGTMPKLTPQELRRLRESMPDLITDQFEIIGEAAEGCDVIVGANAHQYAAPSIAEYAGIGCVTAVYAPVALPSPDLAPPPTPGQAADATTRASIEEQWRDTARVWNERALERINYNRDQRPGADRRIVDATLAPVPATPGREIFQTGTWVLADDTPVSKDVDAFLEGGEPPILVGFGSMPAAADVSRRLIGAVRAVGRRIIVSRGWADLDLVDNAPDCVATGDVNYDLLLPRVAAIVHHGGAGTTAAAARAGVPQVVAPMFSDQFYWANRIVDLGLGVTTPHSTMTEESLTASLREVLRREVGVRAHTLAVQLRRDGAEVAARRLELEHGATQHGAAANGALPRS